MKNLINKVKIDYVADKIAESEGITKTTARRIVRSIFDHIVYMAIEGKVVAIKDFAQFSIRYRAERDISSPQTGERISIPEGISLKVLPSSTLKKFLNKATEFFRKD